MDRNWNCLARAVYDNFAETCDELAFRKNDMLTVLDQTPGGLSGWWLCSLRGRQGIAPANRLRLIPNTTDPTGLGYNQTYTNKSLSSLTIEHINDLNDTTNSVASIGNRRRSWHMNSNRVQIPQKIGDIYLYDVPHVPQSQTIANNNMVVPEYDFPVGSTQSLNSRLNRDRLPSDSYDTPPTPRAVNAMLSQLSQLSPQHSSTFCCRSASAELLNSSSHVSQSHFSSNGSTHHIPQLSSSSSSLVSPLSNRSSLDAASLSALSGCSNRSSGEQRSTDLYDIPPQPKKCDDYNTDTTDSLLMSIPPAPPILSSIKSVLQFYDIPTNNSSVANSDSIDGVRSYDIPRINNNVKSQTISSDNKLKLYSDTDNTECAAKTKCIENSTAIPLSSAREYEKQTIIYSAIEAQKVLLNLQIEVESVISKLFSFVTGTNWRSRDNLSGRVDQLKIVCYNLRSALKKFIMFGYGALANANYASDKTLSIKLCKLLNQLGDSNSIIENSIKIIDDKCGWSLDAIAIKDDELNKSRSSPDYLDQLIACARGVIEDVKHTTSFIRGNAKLIFTQNEYTSNIKMNASNNSNNNNNNDNLKQQNILFDIRHDQQSVAAKNGVQSRPLPPLPPLATVPKVECNIINNNSDVYDEMNNDYDYVCLESKEIVDKQNRELKLSLPQELHKSYDCLVKSIDIPVENQSESDNELLGDYRVLHFYSEQMDKHKTYLLQSIDAFIHIINNNQPPKIFMNHSKFVVIAAQKLIYIGDTVTRNISHSQIRANVSKCANSLCDSLKVLVINTKKAAINFPSVTAVQDMVDSVVDVSFCANQLFIVISKSVKSI